MGFDDGSTAVGANKKHAIRFQKKIGSELALTPFNEVIEIELRDRFSVGNVQTGGAEVALENTRVHGKLESAALIAEAVFELRECVRNARFFAEEKFDFFCPWFDAVDVVSR
ncbi:MAG: hypothetical protein GXX91_14450, partial [Verrucomicrobiaceae bacterium]|nr:hypothetical protein [Verrucomicrobiaceae bacterium]